MHSWILNLLYFILGFFIYNDQGWVRETMIRYCSCGFCQSESVNMKYWVTSVFWCQLKSIIELADLFQYLIWTVVTWSELTCGLSLGVTVSFKVDMVSLFELRSFQHTVVVEVFHLFSSEFKCHFGVFLSGAELTKSFVSCWDISLSSQDLRFKNVTVDELKQCTTCGWIYSTIQSKLCNRESFSPVILSICTEDPKVLLNLCIDALCFAVSLRVVGRRHGGFDANCVVDCLEEFECKYWPLIRDHALCLLVHSAFVPTYDLLPL